jgi:hypothetical protein
MNASKILKFLNPETNPRETRASKLRWYFGIVGLLCGFGGLVEATTVAAPLATRLLGVGAVLVSVGYLASAVFFRWVLARRTVSHAVLGMALAWLVALSVYLLTRGQTQQLIPVGLFLAAPWLVATWTTRELSAES